MRITVCGPVRNSVHDEWEFEIASQCDRVIVTPEGFTIGAETRVWGFKGERQIEGKLLEYRKDTVWMA